MASLSTLEASEQAGRPNIPLLVQFQVPCQTSPYSTHIQTEARGLVGQCHRIRFRNPGSAFAWPHCRHWKRLNRREDPIFPYLFNFKCLARPLHIRLTFRPKPVDLSASAIELGSEIPVQLSHGLTVDIGSV